MARMKGMPSLAKMEKLLGVKFTPESYKVMQGDLPKDSKMGNLAKEEATLDSLFYPEKARIFKRCKAKDCGQTFATTYRYVAYCSDYCRRTALSEDFGIEVVNETYKNRPDDLRWGGTEYPLIVPPEALAVMKYLVMKAEAETGQTISPWSAPEPEPLLSPQVSPSQSDPDNPLAALLAEVDEELSDIL